MITLFDASPLEKRTFSFSETEADHITKALEFSAAWDKVPAYYVLKRAIKETAFPCTIALTQREAWRIVDALMLRKTQDQVPNFSDLKTWIV